MGRLLMILTMIAIWMTLGGCDFLGRFHDAHSAG